MTQSTDRKSTNQGLAEAGPDDTAPPSDVVDHWRATGVVPPAARWVALSGGRTNAVWRIDALGGIGPAHVCKLYRAGGDTPIFANDPIAEQVALAALDKTGLAPRLIAASHTASGASLIYSHIEGRGWRTGDDLARVAHAFARLHAQPVPPELPKSPCGAETLHLQTCAMLADLGPKARALEALDPCAPADLPDPRMAFVHGDATAGNILVSSVAVTFIDWQCPAQGDAADDLAIFLSPAMQAISGNPPLSPEQVDSFLSAYGHEPVAQRFRALAPLYHWRMATYCLWRAARGDAGYGAAATLELAALTG